MRHFVRWVLIPSVCFVILFFTAAVISVISRPENFNPITALALGWVVGFVGLITIWPIWVLTKKNGVANSWKSVRRWLAD